MMFHSETSGDQGTDDPDDIDIQELIDGESGDKWLHIIWYGAQYEDAWINANKEDVDELDDKL